MLIIIYWMNQKFRIQCLVALFFAGFISKNHKADTKINNLIALLKRKDFFIFNLMTLLSAKTAYHQIGKPILHIF